MRKVCLFLLALLFLAGATIPSSVSASQVEVSRGKPYRLLTPASAGFPDDGTRLTNGRFGTPIPGGETAFYYRSPEYVGFRSESPSEKNPFVILLDLGEVQKDLSSFALHCLYEPEAGIPAPASVSFAVSDTEDGVFEPVGEASPELPAAADVHSPVCARLTPEKAVSGRFVRCTVTPAEGIGTRQNVWTFLDELTVLQGGLGVWDDASFPTERPVSMPRTGDGSPLPLSFAAVGAALLTLVLLFGKRSSRAGR